MTKSCRAGHVGGSLTAKHTPGPWKFSPPDGQVQDLFTPEYFFIEGPGADVHGFMTLADARLIAAAPKLFAILVEILESDDEAIADMAASGIPIPPELLVLTEKTRALVALVLGGAA